MVLVVLMLWSAALGNPIAQSVELVKSKNKIDVKIGGRLFTSYVYGNELTKPMLVPLRSPSGIEVTRRNPLVKIKGGSDDHRHHVGIFFAVDKVNGTNFWNNAAPPPQIKHIKTTEITADNSKGKLSTVIHWLDQNGNVLLEENRSMAFLAGENEYAIDVSIDLTARITARFGFSADTVEGRLNMKAKAGGESYLPIVITNTGTATLDEVTFSSTEPQGWSLTFNPEKIEALAPGNKQEIEVAVKPPSNTIAGDYSTTLRFNSEPGPSSEPPELDIRVTVTTPVRWGWIGVGIVVAVIAGLAVTFTRLGRR